MSIGLVSEKALIDNFQFLEHKVKNENFEEDYASVELKDHENLTGEVMQGITLECLKTLHYFTNQDQTNLANDFLRKLNDCDVYEMFVLLRDFSRDISKTDIIDGR